jgi:D-serine deaminase-like pyridoxal phosphate-dependent protein
MLNIIRPTLLIDETKCRHNIHNMKQKAERNGAIFRPHFKTHQSGVIGEWFRQAGVKAITVSSVEMAGYFVLHGWEDITIAFPVNLLEIDRINEYSKRIQLNLLLEDPETASLLSEKLIAAVGIFIKIDVGTGRTGIPVSESAKIEALAEKIRSLPRLALKGLLSHAGHTYHAHNQQKIENIAHNSLTQLNGIKQKIGEDLLISWGDTPSCSILTELDGADEWRPGNFVFYDLMQEQLGSCLSEDIAVMMACPVVAVHHDRVVIHGGAVHFSKEFLTMPDGENSFGKVFRFNGTETAEAIDGARFTSISQEHGVVYLPEKEIKRIKVTDILAIQPVHSCLTVSAMKSFLSLTGEQIPCMK